MHAVSGHGVRALEVVSDGRALVRVFALGYGSDLVGCQDVAGVEGAVFFLVVMGGADAEVGTEGFLGARG